MPSIDDVFGGTTLKAADIPRDGQTVTIMSVEPREFKEKDGTIKTKLLITFIGAKKALVCNKTNSESIARLYGRDYTAWAGEKIRLGTQQTPMGPGICVLSPNDKIETGPRKSIKEEMSDDIPF